MKKRNLLKLILQKNEKNIKFIMESNIKWMIDLYTNYIYIHIYVHTLVEVQLAHPVIMIRTFDAFLVKNKSERLSPNLASAARLIPFMSGGQSYFGSCIRF